MFYLSFDAGVKKIDLKWYKLEFNIYWVLSSTSPQTQPIETMQFVRKNWEHLYYPIDNQADANCAYIV